jgi:hypothetical protein
MQVIYGTTETTNGTHQDTSKTLLGAKQYATRNDLKTVSKRMGYIAKIASNKVGKKWIDVM